MRDKRVLEIANLIQELAFLSKIETCSIITNYSKGIECIAANFYTEDGDTELKIKLFFDELDGSAYDEIKRRIKILVKSAKKGEEIANV